jgi:selenocysteine-specific elongation factor
LFKKELNSNQSCNAILHLESKIGITLDELFLVRSYSPLETIASGIVLDFGTKVNKELIDKYPTDRTERLVFMIKIHSNKPLTIEEWSKKYFISEKEFKTILESLSIGVVKDGLVYLFEDLNYWKNEVLAFIKEKTNKKSFRNYVEMNNIAINLNLSNVWSHYIIKELENDKVLKLENGKVKIVGQVNMIDKKLDEKINNIENIIKNSPKEIISINELIKKSTLNPKQVKELIFFLNDNGKAKMINENIIISIMAFNSLIDSVEKHFKDSENMSVSNFKDLSGFSRKNAIPMLEYFDKNGFTIRNGAERMKGEYFFDEEL